MHVVADHGAVLVGAVVVGGDAAGAEVDALADAWRRPGRPGGWPWRRAASVAVLDLDEVADVHLVAELGAGAQPRERADQRAARRPSRAVDVGERVDHRAGGDAARRGSRSCAPMRTPSPSVTSPSKTQLTSISTSLPQCQRAAQVEARRVGQAHAGFHQRVGLAALEAALEVGQLQRAVDAQHLGLARRPRAATTGTPSATAIATMSVR